MASARLCGLSIMDEIEAVLNLLFGTVPSDLVAYYRAIADGALSGFPKNEVNLLQIQDAIEQTKRFREFHPAAQFLGGFLLDDPNTSNHHFCLTTPPIAGSILFLDHDGDTRIVFLSLAEFLQAARVARASDQFLSDLHPPGGILIKDQVGLSEFVRGVIDNPDETNSEWLLITLIPSMDLTDLALVEHLAGMDNFYISEAVGDGIARRPNKSLLAAASACAGHSHPQAQRAGQKALAAIGRQTRLG